MYNSNKKIIYISWSKHSQVSDTMAYYLGAKSYCISYFKRQLTIFAPLKYILATFKTIFLLQKNKPDIVFVQNPPVFAVLAVWIYCLLYKSQYVVDSHSGVFTLKRWAIFLWLYRYLSKRALVNLLHNEPLKKVVSNWGAQAITLEPGPMKMKTDGQYPLLKGFNVVVVSTYSEDEPISEVINAAKHLPNINFYITGSLKKAPKNIINNIQQNIVLTDFISPNEYGALLKGCDVVVCLTKNDNTMQSGALEALELGRPIITSDWNILQNYFYKGTIHIDNTAVSLEMAIEKIRKNHSYYLKEVNNLREECHASWARRFSKLLEILNETQNSKLP